MTINITALWEALGWAVLHSLWQGALIGAAVWAVRVLATPRRAQLRYAAGMTGLVATFGAFLTTFAMLLSTKAPTILLSGDTGATGGGATLPTGDAFTMSVQVVPTLMPDGLDAGGFAVTPEALVPWLGILWAVGFACLGLQAFRAWSHTRHLSRVGLSAPDGEWAARFERLLDRSGAARRTRLFVSTQVAGPLTLGTLKPLVLVPAGFLSGMPAAQVEAVLLHELAHIRRHDFLFGLVQTAIRTVLWFNPAVILMARQVDEDREEACDDIAVSVTGRPDDLARGLAMLRLRTATPSDALVMAADGGPLLTRLNRLMGRPVERSAPSRLSAAAVSALMLGTAACSTVSVAQPANAEDPQVTELPDTVVRARRDGRQSGPQTVTVVDPDEQPHTTIFLDPTEETMKRVDTRTADAVYRVDADDLPPMPVMPEMPAMPPMPPMPAMPPMPDIPAPLMGDYDNLEAFEEAMDAWGDRMDAWGERIEERFDDDWDERMEAWGEEVEARFEGDWEDRMEAWGEEMEAWGEEVERIAEAGDIADFVVAAALSSADSGADMDAERALARAERWRERAERDAERIAERAAERALREQSREVERMEREAERALRNAEREIRKAEAKAEADRRRLSRKDYERSLTISNPKTNNSIQVNGRELRVDDLRKSLMAALRKDGLVSRNDKTATLRLDGKAMTVDGRRVATKEVLRYAGLIEDAGLPVTGPMKIDLSPDSVGISFSAGAERNRVTYGRYDHSDK